MKVSFKNALESPKGVLCFGFKLSRGDRIIPSDKAWKKSTVFSCSGPEW